MTENQEGEEAMLYDEEDEIAVDEGLAVRKGTYRMEIATCVSINHARAKEL